VIYNTLAMVGTSVRESLKLHIKVVVSVTPCPHGGFLTGRCSVVKAWL